MKRFILMFILICFTSCSTYVKKAEASTDNVFDYLKKVKSEIHCINDVRYTSMDRDIKLFLLSMHLDNLIKYSEKLNYALEEMTLYEASGVDVDFKQLFRNINFIIEETQNYINRRR